MLHDYASKTLKPGFFWYAVGTNLFRLESTNPKKKIPAPGSFLSIFFFKNVQIFLNKHFFYFQKCSNSNTLSQGTTSRSFPPQF